MKSFKISCDLTGKELRDRDLEHMTVCSVIYKKVEEMEHKGAKYKVIKDVEPYEFHISADKSSQFMEKLKKVFEELKEE